MYEYVRAAAECHGFLLIHAEVDMRNMAARAGLAASAGECHGVGHICRAPTVDHACASDCSATVLLSGISCMAFDKA